jgi:hypothetical protein
MTDKDYQKAKKRVEKYIEKWRSPMGLDWWKIYFDWHRVYHEDSQLIGAQTNMNRWQYREADIDFYLPHVVDIKDEEVEHLVVHELTHVLLSAISVNMRDLNDDYQHDLMELNTELVASAFLWIREDGEDNGKKSANRSK